MCFSLNLVTALMQFTIAFTTVRKPVSDSEIFLAVTIEVFNHTDIPRISLRLFLIYLQSGSVYVFGESVSPSGGDNKCFIGVYLETARAAMFKEKTTQF